MKIQRREQASLVFRDFVLVFDAVLCERVIAKVLFNFFQSSSNIVSIKGENKTPCRCGKFIGIL